MLVLSSGWVLGLWWMLALHGSLPHLPGSWQVAKQDYHDGALILDQKLIIRFLSFEIRDGKCTVTVRIPERTEEVSETYKLRLSDVNGRPAIEMMDADGGVVFQFLYRRLKSGGIQLAKGIGTRRPTGFDLSTDKIVLLTCEKKVLKK
jgi:hypothetical protein